MIRQGDVLLERIDSLPKNIKEKDKVLALGEATGHSHRFESSTAKVFVDNNGKQFVETEQETELIHEEHENIVVPAGVWAVRQQREYDIQEGVRQVLD